SQQPCPDGPSILEVSSAFQIGVAKLSVPFKQNPTRQSVVHSKILIACSLDVLKVSGVIEIDPDLELMVTKPVKRRQKQVDNPLIALTQTPCIPEKIACVSKRRDLVESMALRYFSINAAISSVAKFDNRFGRQKNLVLDVKKVAT